MEALTDSKGTLHAKTNVRALIILSKVCLPHGHYQLVFVGWGVFKAAILLILQSSTIVETLSSKSVRLSLKTLFGFVCFFLPVLT